MASGRIDTMDIHELIRLFRAGESDRQIARLVGHNRRTVTRYRTWATEQGLLVGELPSVAELHRRLATTWPTPLPPQQVSSVASYAEEIAQLRARGIDSRPFFVPLHDQPPYRTGEAFPVAARLARTGMNLPSGTGLGPDEIATVCRALRELARD